MLLAGSVGRRMAHMRGEIDIVDFVGIEDDNAHAETLAGIW